MADTRSNGKDCIKISQSFFQAFILFSCRFQSFRKTYRFFFLFLNQLLFFGFRTFEGNVGKQSVSRTAINQIKYQNVFFPIRCKCLRINAPSVLKSTGIRFQHGRTAFDRVRNPVAHMVIDIQLYVIAGPPVIIKFNTVRKDQGMAGFKDVIVIRVIQEEVCRN